MNASRPRWSRLALVPATIFGSMSDASTRHPTMAASMGMPPVPQNGSSRVFAGRAPDRFTMARASLGARLDGWKYGLRSDLRSSNVPRRWTCGPITAPSGVAITLSTVSGPCRSTGAPVRSPMTSPSRGSSRVAPQSKALGTVVSRTTKLPASLGGTSATAAISPSAVSALAVSSPISGVSPMRVGGGPSRSSTATRPSDPASRQRTPSAARHASSSIRGRGSCSPDKRKNVCTFPAAFQKV